MSAAHVAATDFGAGGKTEAMTRTIAAMLRTI
jgi:hypothetical protein